MKAWRNITYLAVAVLGLCIGLAPAQAAKTPQLGDPEVKMGKEAAAEVVKEYKLSDNAADLKRVRDIGEKLAAAANKTEISAVYGSSKVTPFQYSFDIVEDDDVNAFSLPGGKVYVHRGLMKFVQSDQELAGVLAHEVIHAAHHHMVYLLQKQAALNNQMAIALLATMLGGANNSDLGNVLMGVQLYQIAKINGYGMQAERDSDHGAVLLMQQAGYNPVGLLTFLERLAKRVEVVDYGIYRSHPVDAERVDAAKQLITQQGLQINRRQTTNAISAIVKVEKIGGVDEPGVYMADKLIYRAAPAGGKNSEQLARDTADRINKALDSDIKMHELKIDGVNGAVIARNQPIVLVSDADAKLMNMTVAQATQIAGAAIRDVVWRQMVDTVH